MSSASHKKPFVDPIVSAPIDALDATRVFGGLLGQVVLNDGSGSLLDDGDNEFPGPDGPDALNCDGLDGGSGCAPG